MLHVHGFDPSKGPHLHARKHLGEGIYYQRVICKGLQVGDEWRSWTHKGTLECVEIISISDSKGIYASPEEAQDALIEAKFKDPSFNDQIQYIPLTKF